MRALIALLFVGALLVPSYAKEKCVSFASVQEKIGSPYSVVFNANTGIYHTYYMLFKEGGVVELTFTYAECWTGEAAGYSLEEFANLGLLNGERFV